jgi:hypothetical protein
LPGEVDRDDGLLRAFEGALGGEHVDHLRNRVDASLRRSLASNSYARSV